MGNDQLASEFLRIPSSVNDVVIKENNVEVNSTGAIHD
jgi:hypothetical protein